MGTWPVMLFFTGWVIIRGGGSWVFSMTELPSEGWVGLGLDPVRLTMGG